MDNSGSGDIFDWLPNEILWVILDKVPLYWGVVVCRRFRDCYRANYIITKLLDQWDLEDAVKHYQVSDLLFVWCCEFGFIEYVSKHYITGARNLVKYKYIADDPDPEIGIPRNNLAFIKTCMSNPNPAHLEIMKLLMNTIIATPDYLHDESAFLCCDSVTPGRDRNDSVTPGRDRNDSTAQKRYYMKMALNEACRSGFVNIVNMFINEFGIDPTENPGDALVYASAGGSMEVIQMLLNDMRVDPTRDNCYALYIACVYNRPQMVKLLLADGRSDPRSGNGRCSVVCNSGYLDTLQVLLGDPRFDIAAQNNEAFIDACRSNHIAIVEFLLQHPGVDPGDQNNEAIIVASEEGYHDIIRLLLSDTRVNPADQNNEAICIACVRGHYSVVWLLLGDPGVNPGDQNNLAIIAAVHRGYIEIVKLLLADPRVDRHAQNDLAFRHAQQQNHTEIMQLLSQ